MNLVCTVLGIWCAAQSLVGEPRVIDGDTLAFKDAKVRLWGIDAPEMNEREGRETRNALIVMIGRDEVACDDMGGRTHGRIVARCFTIRRHGGTILRGHDLGLLLVSAGRALDCPRFSQGFYRMVEAKGARERIKPKIYCQ